MKKQIILTVIVLAFTIVSCGKSPEKARKELGKLGIAYNTEEFRKSIQNEDELAVKLFLQSGIDPSSGLNEAIKLQDIDLVKKLLKYGADPNYNETESLITAIWTNNEKIIELLLKKGAETTSDSLYLAIRSENNKFVKLLLDRDIDIDSLGSKGNKLLNEAVANQNVEALKLLIEKGFDPNNDVSGNNSEALIKAIQVNNPVLVKILLDAGANPLSKIARRSLLNIYKTYTYTTSDLAKDKPEILKLLKNAQKKSFSRISKAPSPILRDRLASSTDYGMVSGKLIYPSDYIPALKICAEDISTKKNYCIETKQNQLNYQIQLPPSIYYVYALECSKSYGNNTFCKDGYLERRAYYTDGSVCGFTNQCSQIVTGNPLPVKVKPGDNISGIIPDWYSR